MGKWINGSDLDWVNANISAVYKKRQKVRTMQLQATYEYSVPNTIPRPQNTWLYIVSISYVCIIAMCVCHVICGNFRSSRNDLRCLAVFRLWFAVFCGLEIVICGIPTLIWGLPGVICGDLRSSMNDMRWFAVIFGLPFQGHDILLKSNIVRFWLRLKRSASPACRENTFLEARL